VNGATFAVIEVHHRSRGQQSATDFYFMYLAIHLSTDFESIFRNQIDSKAKDSSTTIAGINGLSVKATYKGASFFWPK
jgi:hypothetical protein